jgi:hypothetical protein
MPRNPDLPCADCGTLMWRRKGSSLPAGQARCHPCRRARLACSPPDAKRLRVPTSLYPCAICNTVYRRKNKNQRTCSRACGHTLRYGPTRCKVTWRTCRICSSAYTARGRRRCSCPSNGYVKVGPVERTVPCTDCGATFTYTQVRRKLTFCPTCTTRRAKDNRIHANHTRRLRLATTERERISFKAVAERDGWRCGLCHKAVDPTLTYPHPHSSSLDHVVPIVHGGTHTYSNIQLSHLTCNLRKQAHVPDQQQLALM